MFSSFRGAVLALVIVPSAGTSQDFDAGMAAAEACDFTTALREWTPLAEQGDVDAQHNFGHMCVQGFGVPQDDAKAVKWFRLAAEQGNADGQTNLLDDLLGSPEPFRGTRRRLSAGLDCRPNLRRRRGLLVKMDQHIRTPLRLAG